MSNKGLFEITFKGVDELIKVAERRAKLLDANVRVAVARTVLWGAKRIVEDCPVDTGRLRASILGYLAQKYGINLGGSDPQAVTEGLQESITEVNGYEGRIGTGVKYAVAVDYGRDPDKERKPLTVKQLRYLFAKGILERGPNNTVIYKYFPKRQMSRGYFRNNIPLIDNYFQIQMREAIRFTERDELMRVTF